MLDDVCQEITHMNFQDTFGTEYKRIELKIKLNSIDENQYNVADLGHLKKITIL